MVQMQQMKEELVIGGPLRRNEMQYSRSIPLGNEDGVPLFSPTQVSAQEEVLHSIFSPYFGPPANDQNASVPIAPKGMPSEEPLMTIHPSMLTNGSESLCYSESPIAVQVSRQHHNPSKSIQYTITKSNSFETTTSVDNAWFVLSTPVGGRRQAMCFASPISEISVHSDRSFKSFSGIPNIEMLSFDFVKQCTSQELLQKIISVLIKEDKFPGLLRVAQQRWKTIGSEPDDILASAANPTYATSLPILPPKSQRVLQELNERLTQATEQERLIQNHQKERAELNTMLKDSLRQVATLRREQDLMVTKLAKALGRKCFKVETVDERERQAVVDEIVKKIISGNTAAKALAEAFQDAEDDRRKAEEAFSKSQALLQKSVSSQRQLERDNVLLSQKIQSLSKELAGNNEHIDKLIQMARSQQRKEWEGQEVHYKKIIQHLKQQIRCEEATVSTKLYEDKVNEARKREAECHDKQRQIKMLHEKVSILEKKLKAAQMVPPPPPPVRQKAASVVPTDMKAHDDPSCNKENAVPQQPPKGDAASSQPSNPGMTIRSSIIQRAGGRKALLAQVKQLRSPKCAPA